MHRFSSSEGYKLYDDTLPTLWALKEMEIQTVILSNSDSRMRLVLDSLGIASYMNLVLLSEESGVEKPNQEMFKLLFKDAALKPEECLHVGDELEPDYHGALNSGISAFLIRRPGALGDHERKSNGEKVKTEHTISGLQEVVDWVRRRNKG
ncbi:hypothetical protein HWV62_10517 [Athelia sp. TMB]|nr:hypothetical protein HWV62_10517 [Athelia sp. TMB]